MEIENLGRPISSKTVTIEKLENNNGYVILGTPKLTFEEMNQLLGVLHHQIDFNVKEKLKEK